MSGSTKLETRRRLMFIGGEDFNFLAYNILVILAELKCFSEQKAFRDHRKLAFLIDLVSTPKNAEILNRRYQSQSTLNKHDLHSLTSSYSKGVSRQPLTARVVHALIKRGLLSTAIDQSRNTSLIWLNRETVSKEFLSSDLFSLERYGLERLIPLCTRLRTVKFETFIERYFSDHGVRTWHS